MNALLPLAATLIALFLASLTPPGRSLRRRLMAKAYTAAQRQHEAWVAARKQRLFADLAGTVLEIGPGTGANFVYLPDRVERWIGLEPNPHMHRELRQAAAARGLPAEFRTVAAAGMNVEPASVDVVISTLVLCSVPDPAAVVRDIHRVLRPGGRFVFLEHVAAPSGTSLRRWQDIATPLSRYFADGCRPNRPLADVIRGGGFAAVELEAFTVPKGIMPSIVSPQIAGIATK
ncbi:MAG: class I SAM-dependent methyltransferase [Planctomycetota bacterium]